MVGHVVGVVEEIEVENEDGVVAVLQTMKLAVSSAQDYTANSPEDRYAGIKRFATMQNRLYTRGMSLLGNIYS